MKKNIYEKNNNNIALGIVGFLIFLLFFAINYFTPYLADDYSYLDHLSFESDKKIVSLFDFYNSVKAFYFGWGGRVLGYIFTCIFSYMPKIIFALLNTSVYFIVVQLVYLVCKGNSEDNKLSMWLGIHFLLWFCVPDYGQVMFWMCGSANYLWTSLFVLLNIYFFRMYSYEKGILRHKISAILVFLIGILGGWAMENMSAAMLVILTLYIVYYIKNNIRITMSVISCYIGNIVGFALLYFAPGNAIRSKSDGEGLSFVFKFAMIDYYWVMFVGIICIIWAIFYFVLTDRKTTESNVVRKQSLLFVIGMFISAYCMMAAPTSPERTWYIVCVYGIIAVGIMYSSFDIKSYDKINKSISIVVLGIMVIFVVQATDTLYCSKEITDQTRARETYILEQKKLGNKDIATNIISHKYPFRAKHDALEGLSDIKEDSGYWINQVVAAHFGLNSLTGIKTE